MRYMELMSDNGSIVSVVAVDEPNFLRYIPQQDIFVGCREDEAIAVGFDNTICCLDGHEDIKGVRDNIILNAVFIDEDEYNRLSYLASVEEGGVSDENDEVTQDNGMGETILTDLEYKIEVLRLKEQVEELQKNGVASPVNDEATQRFYETLSSSSTNTIAKIRAAAQQYLDDTSQPSDN